MSPIYRIAFYPVPDSPEGRKLAARQDRILHELSKGVKRGELTPIGSYRDDEKITFSCAYEVRYPTKGQHKPAPQTPCAVPRPAEERIMSNVDNLEAQRLALQLAEMQAEIALLKAEKAARRTITFKVSEKGGVSVYGLNRLPVTLYGEQWERLLAKATELGEFIKAHAGELTRKAA